MTGEFKTTFRTIIGSLSAGMFVAAIAIVTISIRERREEREFVRRLNRTLRQIARRGRRR